jgi:hypothetical protein
MYRKTLITEALGIAEAFGIFLLMEALSVDLIHDAVLGGSSDISAMDNAFYILTIDLLLIWSAMTITTNFAFNDKNAMMSWAIASFRWFLIMAAISGLSLYSYPGFIFGFNNIILVNALFVVYQMQNPGLYLVISVTVLIAAQVTTNIECKVIE